MMHGAVEIILSLRLRTYSLRKINIKWIKENYESHENKLPSVGGKITSHLNAFYALCARNYMI